MNENRAISKFGRNVAIGIAIVTSFTLVNVFDASAHGGATGIVKERMESMKSIGRAGKVLSNMAKGKQTMDAEEARELAMEIRDHAMRIPELFPNTMDSKMGTGTEASPEIWEKWAEFEGLAQQLADASDDLASVAETADADEFREQFTVIAKTCRSCHKGFRIKKK